MSPIPPTTLLSGNHQTVLWVCESMSVLCVFYYQFFLDATLMALHDHLAVPSPRAWFQIHGKSRMEEGREGDELDQVPKARCPPPFSLLLPLPSLLPSLLSPSTAIVVDPCGVSLAGAESHPPASTWKRDLTFYNTHALSNNPGSPRVPEILTSVSGGSQGLY